MRGLAQVRRATGLAGPRGGSARTGERGGRAAIERFAQARRKLTMTDSNIRTAVAAWLSGDTSSTLI